MLKLKFKNLGATLKAFTLSEVLITIAIIGIIACLTLPALVQGYKKRVVETKLVDFYSNMNNALRLSEIENGNFKSWPFLTDSASVPIEVYNKYWKNYLKVTKVEELENDIDSGILLYFANGSLVRVDRGGREYEFYTDSSKYSRKRDKAKLGVDVFMFRMGEESKEFEPYKFGWDGTKEMLLNNSTFGCSKEGTELDTAENVNAKNFYCTALIQINGWKIPKDYPLKF